MMPNDEYRARLLKRLALVVSDEKTYRIRLCAVRSIQASLPAGNPLKWVEAEELLDRASKPWDSRLYLIGGRGQLRRVSRPPVSLSDVW
jgi:hypothetical protein